MNFVLSPVYDQSNNSIVPDTKESSPNENEHNDDYNEMITINKTDVVSSVDKKRLNKVVSCPKCGKNMNRKTLTYSHDCQKIKQPIPSIKAIEKQITDEDVHDYLLKQETLIKDTALQQKRERFNNMISRAF